MTEEEKKLIRDFNRNVEWLKMQKMKSTNWITAHQLVKKTGWDKEELRRRRDRKELVFKKSKTGGFLYLYEEPFSLKPPAG